LNEVSCCAALAAAEMAMLDLGAKIKPGTELGPRSSITASMPLTTEKGTSLSGQQRTPGAKSENLPPPK